MRIFEQITWWWMDAIAHFRYSDQISLMQFCDRLIERKNTGELWGDKENAELH